MLFGRTAGWLLIVGMAVACIGAVYCYLVSLTGDRAVQSIGLPVISLLVIGLFRAVYDLVVKCRRRGEKRSTIALRGPH